jgi:S1-C subfamily serine protease
MSERLDWEISAAAQPNPDDYDFDLIRALGCVVSLRSRVPPNAFTAQVLGTERGGYGVQIGDNGLVLTIGYLITEADQVWLVDTHGKAANAHVVGYDQETGFGLVQPLEPLAAETIALGDSADLRVGDPVVVAGHGGRRRSIAAQVVAKREFAGYWEYVLDEGIFTAPPHPNWGGAGLIGADGTLLGIGSLLVRQAGPGEEGLDGNMVVPIDILKPILDDLMRYGRTQTPPRPWLGMLAMEAEDRLVVAGLTNGGPAHKAEIHVGDMVVEVDGEPVDELANMFRRVWAMGDAGVDVPLTVLREGETLHIRVRSARRGDYLIAPQVH